MNTRSTMLVVAMLIALAGECAPQSPPGREATAVSVTQLLSNPEKYDGKRISVTGYLVMQYESNLLYLHKTDFDNALLGNAVWVDGTKAMFQQRELLEYKYVRIIGIFRAKPAWKWVGKITDIDDFRMWSDPGHPVNQERQHHPATPVP